jgi:hypothetical protein
MFRIGSIAGSRRNFARPVEKARRAAQRDESAAGLVFS